MRKMLGIALLLMLAFGVVSGFAAHAQPMGTCGDLGTPVDVSCRNPNQPDPGAPDASCTIWVAPGTGTPYDGCSNPV